ncbi:MAG: hypothetical protein ACP5UZ_03255 [Thermoplasmata archaeon]
MDDEFVIQMDDTPPFSWIKQTPNRFMTCSVGRKLARLCVNASGSAFEIGQMAKDILGADNIDVSDVFSISSDCAPLVISYSGQLKEAIKAVESSETKGIAISSGGMIKNTARSKSWDYISLPKGYSGRFLFPEIFGCLLSLKGKTVNVSNFESFTDSNLPSEISENNVSKLLALALSKGQATVIYGNGSYGLAKRYKTLFLLNSGTDIDIMSADQYLKNYIGNVKGRQVISFIDDPRITSVVRIGDFPYDNTTLEGYVKNELVGELASLYFGLIEAFEIELFDTTIE